MSRLSMPVDVFLVAPAFDGTLAAVRTLGRAGIAVHVGHDGGLHRKAAMSRYVRGVLPLPQIVETSAFIDEVEAYGRTLRAQGRRCALLPVSDDSAFLYGLHQERLRETFELYQPSLANVFTLLDKKRLYELAASVGIVVPDTCCPVSYEEAFKIAKTLRFPLLIKPRTQALLRSMHKGTILERPADVERQLKSYMQHSEYASAILQYAPDVHVPMLQAFDAQGAKCVYGLSGFRDRSGELVCYRAARKELQRPRRVGVGLCFSNAAVEPALAERTSALLARVQYHGAFEFEFLASDDKAERWSLIDSNPRFFGQIGFDIVRGLNSPLLTYLGAIGDQDGLEQEFQRARAASFNPAIRYRKAFGLAMLLAGQGIAARMPRAEFARFAQWLVPDTHTHDFVLDGADPLPGLADALSETYGALRHPRAFLRQVVLDNG